MKRYILTDIEGVAGVANFEDYAYSTGRFYPQSRPPGWRRTSSLLPDARA